MDQQPESVQIPLVYIGAEDVPILFANQFVSQFIGNEFMLTIGQLQPPILVGTDEQRKEQAERLSFVGVKVIARIGMSRERVVELVEALQTNLQQWESQKGT